MVPTGPNNDDLIADFRPETLDQTGYEFDPHGQILGKDDVDSRLRLGRLGQRFGKVRTVRPQSTSSPGKSGGEDMPESAADLRSGRGAHRTWHDGILGFLDYPSARLCPSFAGPSPDRRFPADGDHSRHNPHNRGAELRHSSGLAHKTPSHRESTKP